MKRVHKLLLTILTLVLITTADGCSDPDAVLDKSAEISNRNWGYTNTINYTVTIDNIAIPYNLYFNARVTGDYKYANMFILLHTASPNIKPAVMRYELHLASQTGEWLGAGSGNLYSYQIPFKTNYHFPAKGTYHFSIEQNMRDNPLHEVSDIGMRIERAK